MGEAAHSYTRRFKGFHSPNLEFLFGISGEISPEAIELLCLHGWHDGSYGLLI